MASNNDLVIGRSSLCDTQRKDYNFTQNRPIKSWAKSNAYSSTNSIDNANDSYPDSYPAADTSLSIDINDEDDAHSASASNIDNDNLPQYTSLRLLDTVSESSSAAKVRISWVYPYFEVEILYSQLYRPKYCSMQRTDKPLQCRRCNWSTLYYKLNGTSNLIRYLNQHRITQHRLPKPGPTIANMMKSPPPLLKISVSPEQLIINWVVATLPLFDVVEDESF
jgi:hypothetical protein